MAGQGGFVFQHEEPGPNGWTIIGLGGLAGTALVIIALALMQLALWAGWALIIVAVGQAAFNIGRGAALVVEARGRARALQREAEGRANALEAEAQTRRIATMRGKPLQASPWRVVEDDRHRG